MIYIDDTEPEGTLEPSFPPRDVTIKRNVNAKDLYELINEIGRGKFGTVYKCREKSTNLELAAKFVPIPKRDDRRNAEREVEIMNSLQHPLIIQLYAAYEYQKMMCVVLELIEGGELFDRVVDDDFVLTERVCTVFMRQVCEGMQFIHRNNILHLDLKPENILCITKTGNRIKIIDFGLARKYDPDKKLQILFGTPEFVAPEVVNFDNISFGTDMWSVGVICYVLLSGLSPFMGETDIETMANVTIAKYDFDDEAFSNVSPEALDFISKLLIKDMSSRMTASECLEHEWLQRRPRLISNQPTITQQSQIITKPIISIQQQQQQQQQQQESLTPPMSPLQKQQPSSPKYTTTPPTPPPVTPEQPPPPLTPTAATLPSSIPTTTVSPPTQITSETTIAAPAAPIATEISKTTPTTIKKDELLEQTKDNLKTFIERWEEHPNSPYVFDTGSHLIAPIHSDSSNKGSSNVSSRAGSPSPCESLPSVSDDLDNRNSKDQISNSNKTNENDKDNINVDSITTKITTTNTTDTMKNRNFKEYLNSFDRRNSDTNYVLGRRPSGEKINLADEIRKLSDHLLMLAEINTKLSKENDVNHNKHQQQQQSNKLTVHDNRSRTNSASEKLETIQESTTTTTTATGTKTTTTTTTKINNIESKSQTKSSNKSKFTRSTSVIEQPTSEGSSMNSNKVSSLSLRLQQSFDKSSSSKTISNGDIKRDLIRAKSQDIEERAAKLINGFKQQFLSPSSASSTNLGTGVPWPITNKRTKFRINQMSRDVPIGSPDTHQPIDLEDAANTTKDCLLHLLEKYNERKLRNGSSGRHQSISVDWNVSENLEYQSMSSINAFFRRHSSKGNYVRQLQAQLQAKTNQKND